VPIFSSTDQKSGLWLRLGLHSTRRTAAWYVGTGSTHFLVLIDAFVPGACSSACVLRGTGAAMCRKQTECHASSLEAPRDVRRRQAADDALDERVAVDARMLGTHRTVERDLL